MVEAMERAGLRPGQDAAIAVDVASSHFYANGRYRMLREGVETDAEGMVERLAAWCGRYPIISVEDGLAEDDWDGWKLLDRAAWSTRAVDRRRSLRHQSRPAEEGDRNRSRQCRAG